MVAAEAREFRGILRHCGPVNELRWPVAFAVAAELNGKQCVFAANGPGPRLAGAVLKAAEVESGKAGCKTLIGAVVSTGFCGGLDPRLKLGDIVEATSVIDLATNRQYASRPISTGISAPEASGNKSVRTVILSRDRVAVTVEEKAQLRASTDDAAAIEMEAAAVAGWALAQSVPFYCVRVVSDCAGDALPMDMNSMRGEDGRFDRLKIARHALLKPWSRVPGLLKLDRDCRVAEQKLGAFFANCRFD